MSIVELRTAVLAKNDHLAAALRDDLAAAGAAAVNLLSSPGSGKTALLEIVLSRCVRAGVGVAALTGDLATENDATRLARVRGPGAAGGHRRAVPPGGGPGPRPPHRLAARGHRAAPVENVGNLVCPASYDLGENLRVVLASVTEGEDKPVKYPTAYRWADLVVLTKIDLAEPCGFDEQAFLDSVAAVNPGVPVVRTSARTGEGVDDLVARLLAVRPASPDPARHTEPAASAGTGR